MCLKILIAGGLLLTANDAAQAGLFLPIGLSADRLVSIELVATKKKTKTVTCRR